MAEDLTLWEDDKLVTPQGSGELVIDVDGFEGPLDLLLALARTQKVDLAKISILKLAEQYLRFVNEARSMRLELAADYLVMAAWLAYLKSKILLPDPEPDDEESAEDLTELLAFRLKRLEAMRKAATALMNRNRLGREVFVRGAPEALDIVKTKKFSATLYDLLTAYALQRQKQSVSFVHVKKRDVWSLQEAREILQRLIGVPGEWTRLDQYLMDYMIEPDQRATVMASSFSASLELVREGLVEMRQVDAFAPLYLKARKTKNSAERHEPNV